MNSPTIALLEKHAENNQTSIVELSLDILLQLCERLPASTLADMIAHTIATDEEGESEPTSDFLYDVGKERFGEDWQTHIESAKARYDTGYVSG
jgi:hypothetical protein